MASVSKQRRSGQKFQQPETVATRDRESSAPRNNWITGIWKLITAPVAIAIVAVALLQWKTLSGIEQLLNVTQRPWVAASVEPIQLTFDDQGGAIALSMTIKNGGAVPAADVLASTVLLLDVKQPYKKACSRFGIEGGIGPILFKDEVFSKTSTAWLPRTDFGQHFPTLVAVCIKYRFAGSSQTGETGYLFSIVHRDPPRPDTYFIDSKNGTFLPPELVLLQTGSYHY
ncbi:MAG TPA: hypothetical protein VMT22_14775 [Terriglobales bacterium]|nr:hypothetical protein [Terriglobales bacterium]